MCFQAGVWKDLLGEDNCAPHKAQHRRMQTDVLPSSALFWVPISHLLPACCQAYAGGNTKLIGVTVCLPRFLFIGRKLSS